MTPLAVPNKSVGTCRLSPSRKLMTSDPRANLFTSSPTWYSPMTSSRLRSSSVIADMLRATVNKFKLFSAPRYVSSSSNISIAVIQLALKSRAVSSIAPSSGLYSNKDMDFIKSPTKIQSPRVATYKATMCPWCEHSLINSCPSSSRGVHLNNSTLELIPAKSLPLNAFKLYTAPRTSFSAMRHNVLSSALKIKMRPREGSSSCSKEIAVPTAKYVAASSVNAHDFNAPTNSFSSN
mmetsp:Transcript_2852/g.10331  ORF Transcript_2852/g.10331 Transcript_2852/m.10331 type:complete len:236 (+) Transcript_2852:362-1069(+)